MSRLLLIIIIFSFIFFLYNKVRAWRLPDSLMKQIYQTKANIAIGIFILSFGANLFLSPRSAIDLTIGIIFALLGIVNIFFAYKAYRHYIPQLPKQNETIK